MCPHCFYHQQAYNSFEQVFDQGAYGFDKEHMARDCSEVIKRSAQLARAFQPREKQEPMGITEKMESLKKATFLRNSCHYFRKQNLLKGTGILPDLLLKKEEKKEDNKRKN